MVRVQLEVTPSGVADGPWAYMAGRGMTFAGNVARIDIPKSDKIQSLQLTFAGNTTSAKVDYKLFLDGVEKKQGTARIYHGNVGALTIRFFLYEC